MRRFLVYHSVSAFSIVMANVALGIDAVFQTHTQVVDAIIVDRAHGIGRVPSAPVGHIVNAYPSYLLAVGRVNRYRVLVLLERAAEFGEPLFELRLRSHIQFLFQIIPLV